jgi:hypothetical protein
MTDRLQPEAFEQLVSPYAPAMADLARRTRALILDVLPEAFEVVWPRQRTVGYGTGPKKMSEHFSWLAVAKAHVTLGFFYGAELLDPDGLLEGTGKRLRHVKLRTGAELEWPALRALLRRATAHRVPPPRPLGRQQ